MYSLEIISEDYQCYIPLERRITVLRGDSGTGKTSFVDIIAMGIPGISIKCEITCRVVTLTDWELVLRSAESSLLIIDDLELVATSEFCTVISETIDQGNYYLIIARENSGSLESELNLNLFSISTNSIFKYIKDNNDINHYVKPLYSSIHVNAPDCVIVEDGSSGYEFFSYLFTCRVVSSNGKGSVVRKLQEMVSEGYTSIIVVFDSAAFGCHMDDLSKTIDLAVLLNSDIQVGYFLDYECFEYFLLRTAFFENNPAVKSVLENICIYANKFLSWEKFFQKLIRDVSVKEMFSYSHNTVFKDCYYKKCKDSKMYNPFRCGKCNYFTDKDKIFFLLENSVFSYFLDYYNSKAHGSLTAAPLDIF